MIILLTTGKPTGEAAETLLPEHGFRDQTEYQCVSTEYLESITASRFSGS